MINDLIRVKDKVAYLMEKYPKTRDCDKTLWLAYLVIFCDLKKKLGNDSYNVFKEVILDDTTCTMESVRRVRQKYQENGQWLGLKRKEKIIESENVRKWSLRQ